MAKPHKKPPELSPVPVVDAPSSRCIKCGSTRRADYRGITRQPHVGQLADGTKYNMVVWRRTHCLDCGQARVDRAWEMSDDYPNDADGQRGDAPQ